MLKLGKTAYFFLFYQAGYVFGRLQIIFTQLQAIGLVCQEILI